MGADLIIASIATAANTTIDIAAGRAALKNLESVRCEFEDHEFESLVDQCEDMDFDDDGELTSDQHRTLATKVLDSLDEALDSRYVSMMVIGGYDLFLTGGLSHGDAPTKEAKVFWQAYGLPSPVLRAMGVIEDPSQPVSRKNGSRAPVTDTDIVDAIALGLGTQSEWSGADALEWIADVIGKVREHPGDPGSPAEYLARWAEGNHFNPLEDDFLVDFVDDEATEDDETNETCSRCGGPWGEDETCERCTDDDGQPRPIDQPGWPWVLSEDS